MENSASTMETMENFASTMETMENFASTIPSILLPAAGLPRFISLDLMSSLRGFFLVVKMHSGLPYLTFTGRMNYRAQLVYREIAHEVLYNVDEPGVAMLRASNGRFWRRNSSGYILADRETTPSSPTSDPACYFKIFRNETGHLLFQSMLDGKYLKCLEAHESPIPFGFQASDADITDDSVAIRDASAIKYAVALPRYVMFLGDNNMYVGDHNERERNWLKFNKNPPGLSACHEVIPLRNGNVTVRNININKFWRRSPDWIFADVDNLSDALHNINCQFDISKRSSTTLAFRSLANDRLLKRYSNYWDDMLCANGIESDDTTAHLIVKEAALSRTLFNIKYLLNVAEVILTPLLVGSGFMFNDSDQTTDLQVQVTLTESVSNMQKWSTSNTFSTSFTVSIIAGIPEVASDEAGITVSSERTISTEMGATISNSLTFQTTYTVKDVPPGSKAKVEVHCTTAKCHVPFTYTSKDTRIDGVDMPPVENIDGLFEGVNAFNIRHVVTMVNKNDTKSASTMVNKNDTKSGGTKNILQEVLQTTTNSASDILQEVLLNDMKSASDILQDLKNDIKSVSLQDLKKNVLKPGDLWSP